MLGGGRGLERGMGGLVMVAAVVEGERYLGRGQTLLKLGRMNC